MSGTWGAANRFHGGNCFLNKRRLKGTSFSLERVALVEVRKSWALIHKGQQPSERPVEVDKGFSVETESFT
jgi:hypothetical protein